MSAANSSPGRLSLFGLPGEIRNEIYRHSLTPNTTCIVSRAAFKQPALLQTCREIRGGAAPIYYHENAFIIKVYDLDFSAVVAFTRHAERWHLARERIMLCFVMYSRSWENLLRGAKAFHEGKMLAFRADFNDHFVRGVTRAFRIVNFLPGIPWESVVKVLQEHKAEMEDADRGWWQWE